MEIMDITSISFYTNMDNRDMLDSSHLTMDALDSLALRTSQVRDASVAVDVEADL